MSWAQVSKFQGHKSFVLQFLAFSHLKLETEVDPVWGHWLRSWWQQRRRPACAAEESEGRRWRRGRDSASRAVWTLTPGAHPRARGRQLPPALGPQRSRVVLRNSPPCELMDAGLPSPGTEGDRRSGDWADQAPAGKCWVSPRAPEFEPAQLMGGGQVAPDGFPGGTLLFLL